MKVKNLVKAGTLSGFTLAEVIVSVVIMAIVIQGVMLGYVQSTQRAEWNARSLAAQAVASQGAEQARCAGWNAQAFPPRVGPGLSDELGLTNYTKVEVLDIPRSGKPPVLATNFVSVTTVSVDPAIRQIRSDCVWNFMSRGMFTNTVVLLRTSDQ